MSVCRSFRQQVPKVLPKAWPMPRIGQGEFAESLKVTLEIPDIKTTLTGRQPQTQHLAASLDERADGVGKLNLASLARRRFRQELEHTRSKHIPGCDGQVARGLGHARLFNHVREFKKCLRRLARP